MSTSLAVIKFGGGLITDKTTPFTARPDRIDHMAAELARAHAALPNTDIVLGNGAGSYGHPPAKQYGLREGAHTPEQFFGMAVTHNGVQQLNTLVVSALVAQNLPAFSLAPSSMLACTDGEVTARSGQPLKNLLASGNIPVVYGDTLTDTVRGTTIYSTERVLEQCMLELEGQYDEVTVVYVMNASGVMDDSGAILPYIGPDYEVQVTHHAGHDVTGGIVSKVEAARRAAQKATRVYIIGPEPGALLAALSHEQVGTQIRLT